MHPTPQALRYAQDIGEYLAVIAGEGLLMQKIVPLRYGAGGMLLFCVCFLLCIAMPRLLDLVIFGRGWRLHSIVTMVKQMPGVRITFDYECYNQKNELLNTGSVTLVFIDKEKNKPMQPPIWFMDGFKKKFVV